MSERKTKAAKGSPGPHAKQDRPKHAQRTGGPVVNETQAFLASLKLVEWGTALEAAKRLLIALDAPPVSPEALERLQKLIRYHGEARTTLVIRTIIESQGNEFALTEPAISAVSQVMTRRPDWPEKGLAWIAAFDAIPLLQILATLRSLEIFREKSLGTYLAASLESRLLRIFTEAPAPEIAPPAKTLMSQARIPAIMTKVALGRELAAIRDRTPNNRKFGELARAKCDLEASKVSDLIRVARAYGNREEIVSRLSWQALVLLSGSTLSAPTRRNIEQRILAGERIGVTQIVEAGKASPPSAPNPPPNGQRGRVYAAAGKLTEYASVARALQDRGQEVDPETGTPLRAAANVIRDLERRSLGRRKESRRAVPRS